MSSPKWVPLTTCANGLEAEIVVARLREVGLDAVVRGNDLAGIFGAGFQGTHTRGWTVLVPDVALEFARATLDGSDEEAFGESDDATDGVER